MRTGALVLSALLTVGALAPSRVARAEILDRVVAVLDEEAIFLSEVETRARPFMAEVPRDVPEAERGRLFQRVLRETLDRMIDDSLIRHAATRLHLTVTDEDVDQFVERIARERGATVEQLYGALEREGITRAEYRTHMETEVRRLKVLQLRVRGRINITDSDLQEAYRRFVRESANASAVRAAHIFLTVPADATPERVAAIAARAAEATRRARAGEDFALLVTQFSEDEATQASGGDLGEIQPGVLPAELDAPLAQLSDGEISDPVRGPNGFHVLRVVSRRAVTAPPFDEVRDRLYAVLLNREMQRQQDLYIRELRRNAALDVRMDPPAAPARPAPAAH